MNPRTKNKEVPLLIYLLIVNFFFFFLQDDNLKRPGNKKTEEHLQAFLDVVRSLGVSLRVYKVNDKWEWKSPLGGEKKILLRKFPDYFDQILPAERVEKTRQLWVVSSH